MDRRRSIALLGLLTAGLALALAFSFLLRPFWYFERIGKLTLRAAGLHRTQVDAPRGRLVYWTGGAGPTVVLLHGANDQAGAWARVAGPLSRAHRLVVPDLPGHGESEPKSGPLSVADLVAGVERVVASEAKGGPVALVGNSLGGWLALICAWRHPQEVSRVVLLNGAAVRARPGVDINLLPRDREEARRAMDALTDPVSPRVPNFVLDDVVRRVPGSPLARLLAAPIDPGLLLDDRLQEIRTPVTLIWGASDRYLPPAYAESLAARLPAARLELLEACGHVPQRECPERLLPALERALTAPPRVS